ncbi:MAG: hypothetical protein FGM33_03890 [Candidatus Kapabacteria bacterium]|nr:hypothetical protein [Candidatus Kapabacteria bacterium]
MTSALSRCMPVGILWILLSSRALAVSQSDDSTGRCPFSIGLSGRYLNPRSTLAAFPGIPTCCDLLSPTQGWAGSLLGEYSLPILDDIDIEAAIGLTSASATLAASSFVGYALDGTDESAKVVRAESETLVELSSLSLEMRLQGSLQLDRSTTYQPHAFGGFSLNTAIESSLQQRERLLSPSSAVFEDTRTKTRLAYSESVTSQLRPWMTINAGLGFTPLHGQRFDVRTRLSAELPVTDIVSDEGKGLAYGLVRLDVSILLKRPSAVADPSPPFVRQRYLASELTLRARSDDTSLRDTAVIEITNALGTRVYSLLPFVFFSQGSSELDSRYSQLTSTQANTYRPTTMVALADTSSEGDTRATLELYYNLLNIVGQRMRVEYPDAVLTIAGYGNNQGEERNSTQLSQRRAMAVREYLHTIWQIDSARLVVTAGLLSPTAASTTMSDAQDRADGHQENRRVELESTVAEVLDPVVITDTLQTVLRPSLIALPTVTSDSSDFSWRLLTQCAGESHVEGLAGTGSPLPRYILDSAVCSLTGISSKSEITAVLSAISDDGRYTADTARLPIKTEYRSTILRRTDDDTARYRYRLTQFQYNDQKLLSAQSSIIQRYITPMLPDNATVQIFGYTDRKGPSELNQKLAADRVRESRQSFVGIRNLTTLAVGEGDSVTRPPFDNTLPEGRLYNRTVEIKVLIPTPSGK